MRSPAPSSVRRSILVGALCLAVSACGVRRPPVQDGPIIGRRGQPDQPDAGPGGKDYKHGSVLVVSKDAKPDGFALFIPDNPKPETADVVVFLHGLAQVNPKMYGGWIEHLVRKGNIVIYPRYEVPFTPKKEFEANAVEGTKKALAELETRCQDQSACVKPNLENLAVLGHSYGGALSANITVRAQEHGLPKVKALMVNQGWYGSDIALDQGYGAMPSDTTLLIVVGSTDVIVGRHFGRRLMKQTHLDPRFKNLVTHRLDKHNFFAPIKSGHDEPLSLNEKFDNGEKTALIAIAFPLTRTNAVDYFCYWKLSDALLSCAFRNTDCQVAFGDTREQRFMGAWGDGRPVRELRVKRP